MYQVCKVRVGMPYGFGAIPSIKVGKDTEVGYG